MIKLIAGLGNPGTKYDQTRHNVGFRAVDELLRRSPAKTEQYVHHALLFETEKFGWVCKPLTFMNRSGKAVAAIAQMLLLEPHEVLVVYDDFALELGLIRIRQHGSSGGHNGLQSIVETFQTTHVPRIRLGIKTEEMDTWVDFVLSDFRKKELPVVQEMLDTCCEAVEVIFEKGITQAMNVYNKKQTKSNE